MERLTSIQTIEHADGTSHEQIYCFGHLWGPAFFKKGTGDYEEYLSIVKRLAEYEDLEEQGKLLKLPCAVGDTVYRINKSAEEPIIPMTVLEIGILSLKTEGYALQIMCRDNTDCGETYYFCDDLGKIIFLTREEAEAALHS